MNQNTNARGVRRTKLALQKSLLLLLENKSIDEISVRELTELADVNRGTFYYHYRDIYALQNEVESVLLNQVRQLIKVRIAPSTRQEVQVVLLQLLEYIHENGTFFRRLLCQPSGTRLLQQLESVLWEVELITSGIQGELTPVHREYYSRYLLSGVVAIIIHWLESGMKESPAEIAGLICNIQVGFKGEPEAL